MPQDKRMNFVGGIVLVIVGYIIGNWIPFNDILFPKTKIQFSEDFVVKAGTLAQQRHFQGSVSGIPIEVYLDEQNDFPKFKLIHR